MQWLSEIFTGILIGYLAVTSSLAGQIERWVATEPASDSKPASYELFSIPQSFSAIPDILLRSSAFQQAAVTEAVNAPTNIAREPIEAIVNIFCTFTTENYIRTTTGTGFFVDSDGVILTNAHVAQFLLLEQTDTFGSTNCTIRTGNPAAPRYRAELLYIPPAWVLENAAEMQKTTPIGTGERDYALLYVTESVSNEPLPASFPALAYDTDLLTTGARESDVVAAGYPATDLLRNGPSTPLIPKQAETTISELYTFGSNYADIFSIRGSDVGAQGASGGPVVNEAGEVVGMIATRGDDDTDGAGSLRAITLSHIHRTMLEETGFSFTENLSGDLPYRSQVFNDTLSPFLLTLLEAERTQ